MFLSQITLCSLNFLILCEIFYDSDSISVMRHAPPPIYLYVVTSYFSGVSSAISMVFYSLFHFNNVANMQSNPLMCSQPEELQRLKNKQRKNKNK